MPEKGERILWGRVEHWAFERRLLTNGAFVLQLALLEQRDDRALAARALMLVDVQRISGSTPSVAPPTGAAETR